MTAVILISICSDFGAPQNKVSHCFPIYLPWSDGTGSPVCSLGKALLAFALLHSVLQGQICLILQVSLDFLFCIPFPYNKNLFWVLVLEGLVGLHRIIQLQLLQHYWSRHRLVLLWYWMVCLGNEQRSFCRFWDCIQVLHFRLFCWLWWPLRFF